MFLISPFFPPQGILIKQLAKYFFSDVLLSLTTENEFLSAVVITMVGSRKLSIRMRKLAHCLILSLKLSLFLYP